MRYLTRQGKNYSRIGLGTARFGTLLSEELSFEMLDVYVANGGNFVDTARNYYSWGGDARGVSETTIGKWNIKKNNRDKIKICTKGGVRGEGKKQVIDLSFHNLKEEVKESLEALQTDYIDVYLIHKDEPERPVEEIIDSLQFIKEYVNSHIVGVSNWSIERIQQANDYASRNNLCKIEAVSTWWSIAEFTSTFWGDGSTTGMDKETYNYLLKEKMMAIAFSSQAKGFFQKAFRQGPDKVDDFLEYRVGSEENHMRLEAVCDYCNRFKVSPTAVVNGYITQNKLSGIALIACTNMEQLMDILENQDVLIDKEWLGQFDKFNTRNEYGSI